MAKGEEKLLKSDKHVETYEFKLESSSTRIKSKEVITTGKTITQIHYPFDNQGNPKYKTIRRLKFVGFDKDEVPMGISNSAMKGYGFTRNLRSFASLVDKEFQFEEILVEKGKVAVFDPNTKTLQLDEHTLRELKKSFEAVDKRNREEVKYKLELTLNQLFPNVFKLPSKAKYKSGALADALSAWGNSTKEFNDVDKKAIQDLFDKLSLTKGFLSDASIAKTKEIIDSQYLQKTLVKFEKLLNDKGTGEKKWQDFLRTNSWIFSTIFAQPVILFQAEAFVGGKKLDNSDGKVTDFLLQNSLSDSITILEIKTHKTSLCANDVYRGTDVFGPSTDLAGALVQVLNQKDNFQKEFYANRVKSAKGKRSDEAPVYESYNSKCVVLCGMIKDLKPEQRSAFELFRNNSKDVDVITFDELHSKILGFQKLLSTK